MADFEAKDYWKLYLNEEAKERVQEIQDHLNKNYDSRSDFLKQKLLQEKPLSLEERINRKQQSLSEEQVESERLKRIKREREEQSQLRDKKELLKEKQKKLRKVQRDGYGSEEDAWYKAASRAWKRCKKSAEHAKTDHESAVEAFEEKNMTGKVQAWKDRELENKVDVDQLVEDVQRLQEQVAELNGGREEWFLDLESVEVSA